MDLFLLSSSLCYHPLFAVLHFDLLFSFLLLHVLSFSPLPIFSLLVIWKLYTPCSFSKSYSFLTLIVCLTQNKVNPYIYLSPKQLESTRTSQLLLVTRVHTHPSHTHSHIPVVACKLPNLIFSNTLNIDIIITGLQFPLFANFKKNHTFLWNHFPSSWSVSIPLVI